MRGVTRTFGHAEGDQAGGPRDGGYCRGLRVKDGGRSQREYSIGELRRTEVGDRNAWRAGLGKTVVALLLAGTLTRPASATSPQLRDISPTGGQRGSELEATFSGERLADCEQVICYEPGIQVLKLNLVTNNVVKAQLKIASGCRLGEHHFRLRAKSGFSELRTFLVGPFPAIEEAEPNDEPAKAQKIALNTTVSGVIRSEDVDCFAVELKKGQPFTAEVEGMRLGRGNFDPRLTVIGPGGAVVADADDTWLGKQDPFVSLVAAQDGAYVIKVREATYGGSESCHYRLHVGTFARPVAVFPAGGKTGETIPLVFVSETGGTFTNQVKLPDSPEERFGVFPEFEQQVAPTPNWVRVSEFPNVLAAAPNQDREHATATDLHPPLALNGILNQKKQEDWFRFPADKGTALNVAVYARRLHSPLDSVIEVHGPKGEVLAANDDSAGADSALKFTPPETTNYFLRIRDTLGQGGPDFFYRVEVTPDAPSIGVKIPEVARNDTQSRQYIAVPRGNRFATLISAKRANFSGEVDFTVKDLPAGLKLQTNRMAANVDSMPLVFEAASDAPIGGRLLDLMATGMNGTNQVTGRFRQDVELVEGPNNTSFYGTSVDKICVAVTKEVPFKLQIVQPTVPLVQSGSMPLQVVTERSAGFEEPIELQMVWNPLGISAQPEVTIPKGATNVTYTLSANSGAEAKTWKIAVLGHATVEGGPVYVSSQLADLEIAPPYLSGKMETLWLNPGKTGKLTVALKQSKPFEGKATVTLTGLPEKVSAPAKEITKDDQEVTFDVTADPACSPGSHRNLFCNVDLKDKGAVIPHIIAQGGILRIVPPKKNEATVAAAGGKK